MKRSLFPRGSRPLLWLALVGIPLIGAPLPSPAGASYQEETPQARLETTLAALQAAESRLDPELRPYMPIFRSVLERVYLDRESATESELQLARAIQGFVSGRAINPGEDLAALKTTVSATPGVKAKPQVVATQRRTPAGQRVGIVQLKVGDRSKVIAEIPSSAGGMSTLKRAQTVANRLTTAHRANPLWWTQAKAGMVGKDYVVAAAQAPGGYVVTADANTARERGVSRETLARRLASEIRTTYDNLAAGQRSDADMTPAEMKEKRRQEAIEHRIAGDAAFSSGNAAAAESHYQMARKADATYVVSYCRLADLYGSRKQAAKRTAVLKAALANPGIDAVDKGEVRKMLARR